MQERARVGEKRLRASGTGQDKDAEGQDGVGRVAEAGRQKFKINEILIVSEPFKYLINTGQ